MCVILFIPDVRLVDAPPAEVTHEEGHTGFLRLPSAVLTLIFLARRVHLLICPFPSLTCVKSTFVYRRNSCAPLVGHNVGKIPGRVTAPRFELTSQRQKVSRLPTEPPER